jgi:hypothetical protein
VGDDGEERVGEEVNMGWVQERTSAAEAALVFRGRLRHD